MFDRPTCDEFYKKYKKPKDILGEYKTRMTSFIKLKHPNLSDDVVERMIDNIVQNRFSDKTVTLTQHDKQTRDYSERTGSLLTLSNTMMNNFIHAPSGSCYQSAEIEKSLHTDFIISKQNERKVVKKEQHKAEADKNEDLRVACYNEQLNIKTSINAISGVMQSAIFFKSKSSYNSITSAARYGITIGYGAIERFITGNHFFKTVDQVINYIVRLKELFPGDEEIDRITTRYNLYKPTREDLYTDLVDNNLVKYLLIRRQSEMTTISSIINKLSDREVLFCYYALNLNNFVVKNTDLFKFVINGLYSVKEKVIKDYEARDPNDTSNLRSLKDVKDGDIEMFAAVFCLDMLNYTPLNKVEDPILLSKFADVCIEVEKYLDSVFTDIFKNFFNIDYLLHNVYEHKEMMRKTTLLSDTDSVIFTLQDFVKRIHGSLEVNDTTLNINAFFIILSFKHLEHMFNLYSVRMNVDKENYNRVQIKNEFMYISLLRMPISKTYIGINLIKEGTYLDPPTLDIKGTIFKSSSLKFSVKKEFNEWIKWLLLLPSNGKPISAEEVRQKVIEMERKILDSKSTEYLTTMPIREEKDYKTPEKSMYFHYLVYHNVFEPDRLEKANLPLKFAKLPLKVKLNYKTYERHLGPLREKNKKVYDRLVKMLSEYPNKALTSLYIPLGDSSIPDEIKYLVDYSGIVSNNMRGFYLVLGALGFGLPDSSKNKKILHDYLEERPI